MTQNRGGNKPKEGTNLRRLTMKAALMILVSGRKIVGYAPPVKNSWVRHCCGPLQRGNKREILGNILNGPLAECLDPTVDPVRVKSCSKCMAMALLGIVKYSTPSHNR